MAADPRVSVNLSSQALSRDSQPHSQPLPEPKDKDSSASPSFSIVLETENLAQADLAGLFCSLTSLEAQSPSPAQANEVLLVDSGDAPADVLAQLCDRYPWLQIYSVPPGIEYYGAKMSGARACTGEIVVYYDSDCIYQPHWLGSILASFTASPRIQSEMDPQIQPEIQVVAGETCTQGVGIYETAMAIAYIFPQYSGQTSLQPSTRYFLNNVAFRRGFLLAHPIPTDLPLYRGNCVIHAQNLVDSGYTIWRQPLAQATHALPNGVRHFFWRFLLIGYDYYWQQRLLQRRQPEGSSPQAAVNHAVNNNQECGTPTGSLGGKLAIFRDRLRKLIASDWRHALFLPLAIPILVTAALLIYVGYAITARKQSYLIELCDKWAVEI